MRKILPGFFLFLQSLTLSAQKVEQGFDYWFKPTVYAPRYYVITEKKDSLWHREAWYLPERSMAMEGWYIDREGKTEHGLFSWYHSNKILKSTGTFVNGKKEGTWLEYGEEGLLRDSAFYLAGRLKGIRLRWHPDGMPADSMNFDGAGNGVEVSWDANGNVSSAGFWVSDTIKTGRWKYYHPNGKTMAIEEYVNRELRVNNCFDSGGKQLDSASCVGRAAEFSNGTDGWKKYIERNLKAEVPVRKGAPFGEFTVVVRFVVDAEGNISQIRSLTQFGYGMEEEVERILKKSPRWVPARQFGRNVKAYRIQPITFVVQ